MEKLEDIHMRLFKIINNNFDNLETQADISKINVIQKFNTAFLELKDGKISIDSSIPIFKLDNNIKIDDRIKIKGKLGLRGSRIRFIINQLEKKGKGNNLKELEKNFKILEKKGYIDGDKKKKIKRDYQKIGIVTSCNAAGFKDFVDTICNRKNDIQITVYDTLVQGNNASKEISKAIKLANKHNWADILVITRGGGSKGDLSCFNDLEVCLAIGESQLPVVTGIGHQIDTFIADEVADKSFITPTATAEGITINYKRDLIKLEDYQKNINYVLKNYLDNIIDNILKYQKILYNNNILQNNLIYDYNNLNESIKNKIKYINDKIEHYQSNIINSSIFNLIEKNEINYTQFNRENENQIHYLIQKIKDKIERYEFKLDNESIKSTILINNKNNTIKSIKDLKKNIKKNDNFKLYIQGEYISITIKINE